MEKSGIKQNPSLKILLFIIPSILIACFIHSKLIIVTSILSGICGIIAFIVHRNNIASILLCFACGLLISTNLIGPTRLPITNKFTAIEGKLFGKVENVYSKDSNFVRLKLLGKISFQNQTFENVPVMLSIFIGEEKSYNIEKGSIILASAFFRAPRRKNIPTDPDEIRIANFEEIVLFARTSCKRIIRIWQPKNTPQEIFKGIKIKLQENLRDCLSSRNKAIFSALLLGDKSELDEDEKEKFSITGMSHILALSGFHFGLVSAIFLAIFSFVRLNQLKFILVGTAILFYLFIVEFPPSGVRATIMILIFLYATLLERKTSILNTLGLILLFILLLYPKMIFSVGFQLSFLAVTSIALFNNPTSSFLNKIIKSKSKIIKYFVSLLAITIAVQILVAPTIAYYFNYYTFISFFSNILLVPIFSLAIIYGFIFLIVSLFSLQFASIFGTTAEFFLEIAKRINDFLWISFQSLVIKEDSVFLLSILLSLTTIFIILSKNKKDLALRAFFASIVIIIAINNTKIEPSPAPKIIPRKNFVAVLVDSPNKLYCLILDRKPRQSPSADIAFERYISSFGKSIIVGYNGNVGIAIADNLKLNTNLKTFVISEETQKLISKILLGHSSIYKI
ncbi:MAG: ComEC/Rec2 family competence protein [Ignavibacteria bacterium]|nr:ComEC/Rec2 family competence protein [Ignavibacteria bacterium]